MVDEVIAVTTEEVVPPVENNDPKPLSTIELDKAEIALELMMAEAFKEAETRLRIAIQDPEAEATDKAKAELALEKHQWERQKLENERKLYMSTLRRLHAETNAPIEILSQAQSVEVMETTAKLWAANKPKPIEKPVEPEPVKPPDKKIDSGLNGTNTTSQDWRNLPPGEKIKLWASSRNK